MRLTVLGNNGTCPGKDGACSAYLLEIDNLRILIDMGNGSLSKLQHFCKLEEIDVIILSHLHFDHFADIFPFKYALESRKAFGSELNRIRLFTTPLPKWMFDELSTNDIFDITYIRDGMLEEIGDGILINFIPVVHLIDSYAIRITKEGKVFTYSSDCGECSQVVLAANHADLFLCESTLLGHNVQQLPHHMTAEGAGLTAYKSGAKRLLLTHLAHPDASDSYMKEAKRYFEKVEVSKMMRTYEID